MKHSEQTHHYLLSPSTLAWVFPILLIVPNIALAFTEHDPLLSKATDIILPLGVWYLLVSASTAIGRNVLLCLPLMVFAAFQIVLLYLYGESIIAIDMYLNIVTTNPGEVTELLGNLLIAIVTILVIYIPPIVWATCLVVKARRCNRQNIRVLRLTGLAAMSCGIILAVICHCTIPGYSIRRNIFPINVISNLIEAVNRTVDTTHYHDTSATYSFNAVNTHPKNMREVYILVVGETSRADNWQLFGYGRETNPRLSLRSNLVLYPKTLSESNTTHKSVPMMLSALTAENYGDSIYYVKGIADAFNEAGFNTAFLSNQQRNHSFIDYFANQAQTTEFIRDNDTHAVDFDLIGRMNDFIERSPSDKIFVTLHCYGSHFNYHERYTPQYRRFTPDMASEASVENRAQLINAYDNTIVATDALLDSIMSSVARLGLPAAVVYTSDHGEDIFDDARERFLHASPTTTFTQIHVPLLIWFSDEYISRYPDVVSMTAAHTGLNISSSRSVFPTMLSIAGIDSSRKTSIYDITSGLYKEPHRTYLNDYNENVDLKAAGFRDFDFNLAKQNNISTD